jgi:hypothetical protein
MALYMATRSDLRRAIGSFVGHKVAANSVPKRLFEFFPGIGFGKDGMTQGASEVAAFIRAFRADINW